MSTAAVPSCVTSVSSRVEVWSDTPHPNTHVNQPTQIKTISNYSESLNPSPFQSENGSEEARISKEGKGPTTKSNHLRKSNQRPSPLQYQLSPFQVNGVWIQRVSQQDIKVKVYLYIRTFLDVENQRRQPQHSFFSRRSHLFIIKRPLVDHRFARLHIDGKLLDVFDTTRCWSNCTLCFREICLLMIGAGPTFPSIKILALMSK